MFAYLVLFLSVFLLLSSGNRRHCCDPLEEPGYNDNPICNDGHRCCSLTGKWSCGIGDGVTFPCMDYELDIDKSTGPFGDKCTHIDLNCCNPLEQPESCSNGYECCGLTGKWICGIKRGKNMYYPCKKGKLDFSDGPYGKECPLYVDKPVFVEECCNKNDKNNLDCTYGSVCCGLNGTWQCRNRDGTYDCIRGPWSGIEGHECDSSDSSDSSNSSDDTN